MNYALTRTDRYLDKRQVIWVRINLVLETGFEDEIEHWMHAQAAKIIFRYYDTKSVFGKKSLNVIDYLFKWIEENKRFTEADKVKKRSALRNMEDVFASGGKDERVRRELCDIEICRELFHYMRTLGWSFVFVLDGFDQLDINPEQVKKFDKVHSSISRFVSARSSFGATLIVVSRTHTFDNFRSYDPFKFVSAENRYFVGEVNFETVMIRRFEAIKKVIIDRIPLHRRDTAEKLERSINGFLNHEFSKELLSEKNSQINISNMRAKLQALYLMFLDFVSDTTGKRYLIIEHMLLNGMRYPAVAYQYGLNEDGTLTHQPDEINFEARFIPLITRYPLPPSRVGSQEEDVFSHILLGIRILQFCVAISELDKIQETMTIEELSKLLNICFSYDTKITAAMIREFAAFDAIRIARRGTLPIDSRGNGIVATPKAKYILEQLVGDVAYLNMCAMRTAFPKYYFSSRHVRAGYVDESDSSAKDWVEIKIINSLSLFGTLILVNRNEHKRFNDVNRSELKPRQQAILRQALQAGLWDLIPSSKASVAVEVLQILSSGPIGWLSLEKKVAIAERVRQLFRSWRVT